MRSALPGSGAVSVAAGGVCERYYAPVADAVDHAGAGRAGSRNQRRPQSNTFGPVVCMPCTVDLSEVVRGSRVPAVQSLEESEVIVSVCRNLGP